MTGRNNEGDFATKSEGLTATVDQDLCVGSTTCVGIAPEIFELLNGIARGGQVPPKDWEHAKEAMESCPVQAISLPRRGGARGRL